MMRYFILIPFGVFFSWIEANAQSLEPTTNCNPINAITAIHPSLTSLPRDIIEPQQIQL